MTALGLLAVVALIAANGFFVLGEFAFVAARREQIEDRARQGDRRAKTTLAILRRLSFALSGAQLGITVTSLVVGYIAEPVFARALAPLLELLGVAPAAISGIALTTGFILSTAAQMVFGELAPKNLGIARPETFSLAVARSTNVFLTVARPVITLFDTAANKLLRAVGIEPIEELSAGVSAEELEVIVSESGEGGLLTPEQTDLLSRVLEFRNLNVSAAMVPRPQMVTLPSGATCEDLRHAALATGHSRFPVMGADPDDVRGIVQAKDILRVPRSARASTPVEELIAPAMVVPETAECGRLLGQLRRARTTMAIVVDEYGGVAGLVTLEDIVEELVGQIRDEYDPEEPGVQALPNGEYLVPGSWRPDEIERDTGVSLPTGSYETVSGLLMEQLGRVPRVNDRVNIDGTLLRVEAMDGHAVARVRIRGGGRGAVSAAALERRRDEHSGEAPR